MNRYLILILNAGLDFKRNDFILKLLSYSINSHTIFSSNNLIHIFLKMIKLIDQESRLFSKLFIFLYKLFIFKNFLTLKVQKKSTFLDT